MKSWQPWVPHWALPHGCSSQHLPKTSTPSFSISGTIWPQNTKLSLEGVSKSKGIWISLWAPQHIKPLMLCKKLLCSSGTGLPQVRRAEAVWNKKLERNSLCSKPWISSIFTSAGPKSLLCTLFPRPCPWQELSTQWHWCAGQGSCQSTNLPASRHHQQQQPGGTGSVELCSSTVIQGCFIHFSISIPP